MEIAVYPSKGPLMSVSNLSNDLGSRYFSGAQPFIKANGVYVGFWLVLFALGLVGVYWAVRLGMIDAIRITGNSLE